MRTVTLLVFTLSASCSEPLPVDVTGNRPEAYVVKRLIQAAHRGDKVEFSKLTGRSETMPDLLPPKIDDVDRREEGCTPKSIHAAGPVIVEVLWNCPAKNYKMEVERSFIVERGRVTHMWNDWGEHALVAVPEE